ncbi:AMP-binding protein [Pseudonocardia hydrocarbonoxydans]|uniref:Long-chain acyl-CoA synthetase n=1 Tax=Pseudonocardia hydrocarbonoxydans TaxID=76726 RepID=A0A4Y3WSP4_9PSEU|nr:AMP-binding protein [Pseudonocardia hydrocarbonoxydans]GEC20799.1 long-chain acyl-CoA synthetase [Pseudonocardia hydrocarbonoxydans]
MDSPTSPHGTGAPRHLAELVTRAAARTPDHPAIVDVTGGTTLTWADIDAASAAEAARLRAAGVRPGDRVVVRLANGAPFCVAVLGAVRADAVAVPIGPVAVPRELGIVFADCTPSIVVAPPDDLDAAGCAAAVGAALIGPPELSGRVSDGETVTHGVGGEDIALLVYTSGTTGTPRGVRLSHRALLANRAQAAELRPAPVTPVDRVLLSLPMFHVFGLAAGFLQVCWAGATAVLTGRFDPEHTAEVLVAHRVSGVAGVPSMFRSLLDLPPADLRAATANVRMCTSGGAPLPARWLADFRDATGLWIFEGYGLTEGGPVLTTNGVGGVAKPGSVGRALPGIELRLVDAEGRPIDTEDPDDDEELDAVSEPSHDTGLVAVRGPNLFSGYWPDGAGGPDADGWFRTADVGFLDADGDLHLVDRSSDLVIVNGFNVYPREVERVLAEIDGVAEAAVVGVADDRTGEAVKAVLVRAAGSTLTEEEVRAHCTLRLARFKAPSVIAFVDELPRTPTGKVARRQLAAS